MAGKPRQDVELGLTHTLGQDALDPIARQLADGADLGDFLPRLLKTLAEALRLDGAVLWALDAPAGVLRCARDWYSVDGGLAFPEARRSVTYAAGEVAPSHCSQ